MNPQIRIPLVDDDSLFRESLRRSLEAEPDFRIAAIWFWPRVRLRGRLKTARAAIPG